MITLRTSTGQFITSHITLLAPEAAAAHRFYGLTIAQRVAREALTLHPDLTHIDVLSQPSWEPAPRKIAIVTR